MKSPPVGPEKGNIFARNNQLSNRPFCPLHLDVEGQRLPSRSQGARIRNIAWSQADRFTRKTSPDEVVEQLFEGLEASVEDR